jgi:hypothetical protein
MATKQEKSFENEWIIYSNPVQTKLHSPLLCVEGSNECSTSLTYPSSRVSVPS